MFARSSCRCPGFLFPSKHLTRSTKCLKLKRINFRNLHLAPPNQHHDLFKILFLGRDEFSCLVLQELYAARGVWEELHVATYPDEKTGRRGSHLSISPLKRLAKSLKLPIHMIPQEKHDFKHWRPPSPFSLQEVQSPSSLRPPLSHHLLITASFGRIIPSSILQLFAHGRRLNVHPSLLPAYRGAAPIQRALMNGETETGVCVIEMMERKRGIDAGEIWGCKKLPIPSSAMFLNLRDTLATEGGRILVSVLHQMLEGTAVSISQPLDSAAPRAPAVTAADSLVSFSSMTAEEIVRKHRAISHQRPLTTYLPTRRSLQLHSPAVFEDTASLPRFPGAAIYHAPSQFLLIRCADKSVLSVSRVKQQDRTMLDAKEWWNGVKGLGQKVVKRGNVVHLGLTDHENS